MPLDQSAASILGLFQKKEQRFCPFWRNEEDFRGTKTAESAPNSGALWGGHFYYKTWLEMRFLAKMLAEDQSNATNIYPTCARR